MPRYIAKRRSLTAEERIAFRQARVEEAEDELARAQLMLNAAIEEEAPLTTTEYVEVKPGEPGYDDAPFENSLIMDARAMTMRVMSEPSPFLSMLPNGTFPQGLSKL